MTMEPRGITEDGRVICVYPALLESVGRQKCDVCNNEMQGTAIAKMVTVSQSGVVVPEQSSDWLHRECAEESARLALLSKQPVEPRWYQGTQRDMIEFIQRHENTGPVIVDYSYTRGRDLRYKFRLTSAETS